MVVIALLVAVGVSTCACAPTPAAPGAPMPQTLTPSDVLASPASFLDKPIEVTGRIYLQKYQDLQACGTDSPTGCAAPARGTLHVVTDGQSYGEGRALDLYRAKPDGGEEPVSCRATGATEFDCGSFKPDAVGVVAGRLVKHRVPTQQVGYPDGRTVVLQYREIFVLLVRP